MELFDLMSISHRYMEILGPSTPEKIIKLGKLLKLKKGSQVIDFGCGCAEPLTLWAEEFGITGIGIDISEDFCNSGQEKTGHERVVQTESKSFAPLRLITYSKRELSMPRHVLGQRLFFGGYQQTIQAMKRAVHQNGRLGIGENPLA